MSKSALLAGFVVAGSAISASALTMTPIAAHCDPNFPSPLVPATNGAVSCSALPERNDIGAVNLGEADGNFFSLGINGIAVFQIKPTFGRDAFVVEVTNPNTTQFEAAEVLVSMDGLSFNTVATATNETASGPSGGKTSFYIVGGPFSFIAFRDVSQVLFPGTTTVDGFDLDSFSVTAVPLPPAIAMLGAALAGLGLLGRRRGAVA